MILPCWGKSIRNVGTILDYLWHKLSIHPKHDVALLWQELQKCRAGSGQALEQAVGLAPSQLVAAATTSSPSLSSSANRLTCCGKLIGNVGGVSNQQA